MLYICETYDIERSHYYMLLLVSGWYLLPLGLKEQQVSLISSTFLSILPNSNYHYLNKFNLFFISQISHLYCFSNLSKLIIIDMTLTLMFHGFFQFLGKILVLFCFWFTLIFTSYPIGIDISTISELQVVSACIIGLVIHILVVYVIFSLFTVWLFM